MNIPPYGIDLFLSNLEPLFGKEILQSILEIFRKYQQI